jgi:prepilin-type N-terminal cleavage/methylation domain-containing protein
MKKAFTIIELLVATALLAMMVAISSMVFSAAVKAYRTANATTEIMARMRNLTEELDTDLRGLRKEGEFILVWAPSPKLNRDGTPLDEDKNTIPDQYISLDRLFFFADVDAQTFTEQTTTTGTKTYISSNLARVCYSFGRDAADKRAGQEPLGEKRLFCRTQHLITGDANLPSFPDLSVAWNAMDFENKNFSLLKPPTTWPFEYQTTTMQEWLDLSDPANASYLAKMDMLSLILDLRVGTSAITQGGPIVDLTSMTGVHNLFSQGIGQFHVQIWRPDLNRWFPELDPDGDGIYNEPNPDGTTPDYPLTSNLIDTVNLNGLWIRGDINAYENYTAFNWDKVGVALKFTFTIYDSKGIFPEGKTFTHIVYLN